MMFYTIKWSFVYTIHQSLINWPLWRGGYFGSWDMLYWPLSLWIGDHCRAVKVKVNVWTVDWDKKVAAVERWH